jgi:predicted adenine nucleotide alpha hydrolase (AANH) superfamily ATPase
MNIKLLLHCCCAPCSVSCVNKLRSESIEPELLWYNPNIHLYTEYQSRRDCLLKYAADEKLKITEFDEYGLRTFIKEVPSTAKERCKKCYLLRMEKTAFLASQEGYNAFSTTLLISPYQDHNLIKRTGEETAEKYGINFFYRDFRPFFHESRSYARAGGFYMQKYCGCIFSEEERYSKSFTQK